MININQIFAGYKKPQNIHEISNIKTIETYNMFEKIITKKKKIKYAQIEKIKIGWIYLKRYNMKKRKKQRFQIEIKQHIYFARKLISIISCPLFFRIHISSCHLFSDVFTSSFVYIKVILFLITNTSVYLFVQLN
ncbi:hypothetical protein PFBG_03682 [Plasmodium falciparum 7G8]|uniref:Transmembrane protein n=2 Tax=Plasmodium falciparum TaxID=5833 RepID=W7EYL5_PLAF8|nr:hypothetical protein PFBG_03682 [Plasmodium falciparum 7G8]